MPTWPPAHRAGLGGPARLAGPLLATATGGRLRQGHLWELVRRLARDAGIGTWQELSPHSLRHSAITFRPRRRRGPARCAGLRRAQGPPHHTRRYDHARDSPDRNAAYVVAAYRGAGKNGAGNRVRPSNLLNIAGKSRDYAYGPCSRRRNGLYAS